MPYVSLAQFKKYQGIAPDETTDDILINSLIERTSKSIETHCSRRFEATTATRYYEMDAVDGNYLRLDDDLISVTTLTNGDSDSTTITSSYYWLWPRNSGPPYHSIRLKAGQTTHAWEVDTDYFITVTGSWGWTATPPEDIEDACCMWVKYKYHQKDSGIMEATAFPAEGIIVTPQGAMPIAVFEALQPYVRGAG